MQYDRGTRRRDERDGRAMKYTLPDVQPVACTPARRGGGGGRGSKGSTDLPLLLLTQVQTTPSWVRTCETKQAKCQDSSDAEPVSKPSVAGTQGGRREARRAFTRTKGNRASISAAYHANNVLAGAASRLLITRMARRLPGNPGGKDAGERLMRNRSTGTKKRMLKTIIPSNPGKPSAPALETAGKRGGTHVFYGFASRI